MPDTWQGPFAIDEVASCSAEWPFSQADLHAGVDGGAFSCACNCTTPPASCTTILNNDNVDLATVCARTDCSAFVMSAGECRAASATPSCNSGVRVEVDGGGPCTPNLQKTRDTPTWTRTAHVCAPNGKVAPSSACKQGEICAPERPASAALCIVHAGSVPCPPGWSDSSSTYYAGYDDTRDCTGCSCGSGGEPCELEKLYLGCTQQDGGYPVPSGSCEDLLPGYSYRLLRTARACTPDGGAPTGALTTTGETTACCRRP